MSISISFITITLLIVTNAASDNQFIEKMLFPKEPSNAHIRRHHVRRQTPDTVDSIESYVSKNDLKVVDAELIACLQTKLGCFKITSFYVLHTDILEVNCLQKNLPILFEMKVLARDNASTFTKVVNGFLPQDMGADSDQIALEPGINENCQKIKRFCCFFIITIHQYFNTLIILIKRYHVNTQKALLTIDGKPFVVERGKEDKIIIDELSRTWNYWTIFKIKTWMYNEENDSVIWLAFFQVI